MRPMLTALVCSQARYAAAPHSVMPIAPSRNEAGASRFITGHDARTAPAASAEASSAVKNERQKVSASGGSQPAARRATRMLAANIAGVTNSRAHAPIGVFMAFCVGRSWRIPAGAGVPTLSFDDERY